VIIHALNGIRLTMLDLSIGHSRQRLYWAWALGAGLVLFLAGAVPMFLFGVWKSV